MRSIYDFDPTFPNTEFRVGFIGSHSVGKSTQVKKLGNVLRIPTITEGVRHVCSAMGHGQIAEVPDPALFQWKVLQWQIAHEEQYGRFVTDRTTIDNAAYWCLYSQRLVSPREHMSYMRAARLHAQGYTHLIYFPIMWDRAQDDGFRATDAESRLAADQMVNELIDEFSLRKRIYTVTLDDLRDGSNARLMEILEHLNLWQTIRELKLTRETTHAR